MHSPAFPIQNINDFFDIYANALEIHDTKGMTFLHQIPCNMVSDDAYTLFSDASKLEGFFNQGMTFYRQFGIVKVSGDVRSKIDLTKRITTAKVNWRYADANRNPIYNCDYHYLMKLDKNGLWKIILSVSINERERMEEWKSKMEL